MFKTLTLSGAEFTDSSLQMVSTLHQRELHYSYNRI